MKPKNLKDSNLGQITSIKKNNILHHVYSDNKNSNGDFR